jgi:hypothetical protein
MLRMQRMQTKSGISLLYHCYAIPSLIRFRRCPSLLVVAECFDQALGGGFDASDEDTLGGFSDRGENGVDFGYSWINIIGGDALALDADERLIHRIAVCIGQPDAVHGFCQRVSQDEQCAGIGAVNTGFHAADVLALEAVHGGIFFRFPQAGGDLIRKIADPLLGISGGGAPVDE